MFKIHQRRSDAEQTKLSRTAERKGMMNTPDGQEWGKTVTKPAGEAVLAEARGSADNVEDVINGLKHMADDHPCCKQAVLKAIETLEAVMIKHCTICYSCARLCPPNTKLTDSRP